jgi:hypothetical protein
MLDRRDRWGTADEPPVYHCHRSGSVLDNWHRVDTLQISNRDHIILVANAGLALALQREVFKGHAVDPLINIDPIIKPVDLDMLNERRSWPFARHIKAPRPALGRITGDDANAIYGALIVRDVINTTGAWIARADIDRQVEKAIPKSPVPVLRGHDWLGMRGIVEAGGPIFQLDDRAVAVLPLRDQIATDAWVRERLAHQVGPSREV